MNNNLRFTVCLLLLLSWLPTTEAMSPGKAVKLTQRAKRKEYTIETDTDIVLKVTICRDDVFRQKSVLILALYLRFDC